MVDTPRHRPRTQPKPQKIRPWMPIVERSVISIDPGLSGTGWVVWDHAEPVNAGIWTPPRDLLWYQAAQWLGQMLANVVPVHPYTTLVLIEMPEYQSSPTREMGWKTGSLQKLTFLVGWLSAISSMNFAMAIPVLVHEWKGQLPKPVVERRVQQTLGRDTCQRLGLRSHAYDAAGIGLYGLGRWK